MQLFERKNCEEKILFFYACPYQVPGNMPLKMISVSPSCAKDSIDQLDDREKQTAITFKYLVLIVLAQRESPVVSWHLPLLLNSPLTDTIFGVESKKN